MQERTRQTWTPFLVVSAVTFMFLGLCTLGRLNADFEQGDWQSLVTRLGLIALASLLVAWRLPGLQGICSRRFWKRFVLVLLFLGALFYPLVSQFSFVGRSVRDVLVYLNKRHAADAHPLIGVFRDFPGTYELYVRQHFKLPKSYVHFDALVKVYGLGVSPNSNVAVGKNGFYFEGWGARKVEKGIVEKFDNIADYMGQVPFTEKELRKWRRTLEARRYWLREHGSEYVFVLAPTKAFVYPEFLPDPLNSIRGRTRYEQLSEYLAQNADIHFIDLLPALLEAKKKRDYPLLFYKTDFHWNFYGAFIAYQSMVHHLARFFPQYSFPVPSFEEFELNINRHWAHHRFMNMIGLPVRLHKNEHYITMAPRAGGLYDSALDLPPDGIHDVYPPKRKITAPDGKSMEIRLIRNPRAPVGSILLLGDSFMEKCVYFFSANARKVMNYRTIVNFPDKIFRYEQPDIVIQEILNMFILRPPPDNPPAFNTSYLRAKFDSGSARELVRIERGEAAGENDRTYSLSFRLPADRAVGANDLLIARTVVHAAGPAKIRLEFTDEKGTILLRQKSRGQEGRFTVLSELPATAHGRITLKMTELDPGGCSIRSCSVRVVPDS